MNIAIILAGGKGNRLGSDIPKQYIKIKDKPIFGYCIDVFQKSDYINKIQITADEKWRDEIISYCEKNSIDKLNGFSMPGETRQLSIKNALCDIKNFAHKEDNIIIHDAARPLISSELIEKCFDAMKECDGVLPVLPMKDTVYLSNDGKTINSLIDRTTLFAGQAPECFVFGKYYKANTMISYNEMLKINGSTEIAIKYGMKINLINGDERNFKITTKADLINFKNIIQGS